MNTDRLTLPLLRWDLEFWAPIPSLPGYEASTHGRIRSVTRMVPSSRGMRRSVGQLLKLWPLKSGYITVHTHRKTTLVSRAVLEAFVGPAPTPEMQACHCNGDRANNRLENLRWDTPKGNEADKLQHGTHHRGERHPSAKLTNDQVAAIRADTRMQRVIAAEYGISRSHVGSIKTGYFRKHG